MLASFLTFLEEKKDLVSSHPWTFIVFGFLLFLIGFVASWRIHHYLIEIKLKDIPERDALLKEKEQLQNRIKELQNENEILKGQLSKKSLTDLANELKNPNSGSIGAVITKKKITTDNIDGI